MLNALTDEEKLRLVRFMSSFAWADLDVTERERNLIRLLVERLGLPAQAAEEAVGWLEHPPSEEDLDPNDIPIEHRRLFVEIATELVGVDGLVDEMAIEALAIFESLLDDHDGEE